MILYDKQPIRTAGSAVYPYDPVIEEIFRFQPKFGDTMSMAIRVGNVLHVPRECVPLGKEDHRVYKTPVAIDCKKSPRNDDQKQVIAASVELLSKGVNHVMTAPTGFGKSYCGAAIACAMGQPTLIIVTKQDLMDSWRKCLIELVGIPAHEIGHIQQDKCVYKGKRFVLAMLHSLVSEDNKYQAEMRNYFGMVIFDECHHLAAENFINSCMMFPAAIRLGLSATPTRGDGKWPLIEAHIGPVLVKGTTIPMRPKILVKHTGWKIPLVQRWVDDKLMGGKVLRLVPIPCTPGRMMPVFKAMAEDLHRNMEIVHFITSCHKKGRRVVVLSELTEHLKTLFHLCSKYIPGNDMDYYTGGRNAAQLAVAKGKPVVFATYQMCGEGTDVPEWDSMVMATPRANVKQAIGRVMRELKGKREPVILDLVDDSMFLKNFYLSRQKQYYEVQATIQKV
jgi:superfamily II DNA or RNA helicase